MAALIALGLVALGANAAVGTTYTVNTTSGTYDGACNASHCSLREAIEGANANTGKDTIAFDIPGPSPHVIVLPTGPGTSHPSVTDAVVVDGFSQGGPGYSGPPLVEIDGNGRPQVFNVVGETTTGSEIRGLAISEGGIQFDNAGRNVVEHNYLGTDTSGSVATGLAFVQILGGGFFGGPVSTGNTIADNVSSRGQISLSQASDNLVVRNRIGTDQSGKKLLGDLSGVGISIQGDRNLIAMNVISGMGNGVLLGSVPADPSDGNRFEGNFVGTDIDGELDLGNLGVGIQIGGAGAGNVVGGTDPAARNVISGNNRAGLNLIGSQTNLIVQGNRIGTNATGSAALGNGGGGIDGGAAGSAFVIAGNVISGNGEDGIFLANSQGRIEANLIGTNAAATAPLANGGHGINVVANTDVVIGGADPTARNVISGNTRDGVAVGSIGTIRIINNYIGTNGSGNDDVGNGEDGVHVVRSTEASTAVHVGEPEAGNVISGNAGAGVNLDSSLGVKIRANRIGTDAPGMSGVPNDKSGVLGGAAYGDAQIGGAGPGEANVISGNKHWGVELGPAGFGTHLIRGNRIGTRLDGTGAIGNALGGVLSEDVANIVGNFVSRNGGDGVQLDSFSNTVRANEITANAHDGVSVVGGERNRISGNSISSNGELGIDLNDDGVTLNDASDFDGGPNLKHNFPVIAPIAPGAATVEGTLNSAPNRTYTIELFANTECDPSEHGEGQSPVGEGLAITDALGNAPFSISVSMPLVGGGFITATATDPEGNTSEFSRCSLVPDFATIIVEKQTLPDGGSTEFDFTGDAPGTISDGERIERVVAAPGTYTVTEAVPGGWDVVITCDDAESAGAGATATFRVVAGDRLTCTFTNTKRGSVTLRKTTNGIVDPTKDICFVLTGSSLPPGGITRCTFSDLDGVLEWPNLVPDPNYTMCESPVPAGFTSFWTRDGVIITPYNPDAGLSPPEDLGNRCDDFSLDPGETVAFAVDNSRPGGDPRTIGYWKNWNRCTSGNQSASAEKNGGASTGFFLVEDLLPQEVGDLSMTSCQQAVKLLSKQDQAGRNKTSDAAYELAAQLLATRFNLAAGAETCAAVQQAVLEGQALLHGLNFSGSGDYLGSKSKNALRPQALTLAATLDQYNNGNLC